MRLSTRRVSEVPELIELICSFVEKSSLASLLTVSQRFFQCVAPLIWKEVPGAAKLWGLIPRLDQELVREEFPVVRPDHLQSCDRDQLTRFSIYAPFVQKLNSNVTTDRDSLGWDLLLSRVPTRPLLPNLRALAMAPSNHQHSSRFFECINAFLCPALSDVDASWHYRAWLNLLEAGDLLMRMAAICPNLTKLNLLLGSSQYPVDLRSSGMTTTARVFTPLSQFRDLRVLRSSSAVLNSDILQLLGNLPCLESLVTCSLSTDLQKDDNILIGDLTLPEHSFPSLRNLEIGCALETVVSKLWQTPLVRNLVSVRVQFMLDDTEPLSDLVCAICQGSPHITDLVLDLEECDEAELSSEATEHLCRLHLQRVRIYNCCVDVRTLVLGLPNVEYLNIEKINVDFEELALIAKHMPKLQYLCARLYIWGWPSEHALPTIPLGSSSPVPCHIESHFTEDNDLDEDDPMFYERISNIARYLHTLWPTGIRCDLWNPEQGPDRDIDLDAMKCIHEISKALSGTSALDVPTMEESGSRWLYIS